MGSIFDITSEYKALEALTSEALSLCENEERNLNEADQNILYEFLIENEQLFEKKVNCYRNKIKDSDSCIDSISKEIARLQKRKKRYENLIDVLKNNLMYALKERDVQKLETEAFTLSLKKCPPSVVIDNESVIPEDFFRVKKEVDKTSIKDALKKGELVAGCHLEENKKVIQFY